MWWPSASTHTLRMRWLPASSRYLYFPNTNTVVNITNTTLNIANTIPHIITNTCDEKAMQLQVHTLWGDFQLFHAVCIFPDTNSTPNIITNTCDEETAQVHTHWDDSQLLHAICILPNTNTTINIRNNTLNITNTTPHIILNTCDEKTMELQVQVHTEMTPSFFMLFVGHVTTTCEGSQEAFEP